MHSKNGLVSSLINQKLSEVRDERLSKDFIVLCLCRLNGKFCTNTTALTHPILFNKDAVLDDSTSEGSLDENFAKQVLKERKAKDETQYVIVLFERGAIAKTDNLVESKEGKGNKGGVKGGGKTAAKTASSSSSSTTSSGIVDLCGDVPIEVHDDDDEENSVRIGIFNGINIKGRKLVACPPTNRKKPSNVHEGNWSSEMRIRSSKLCSTGETTALMLQYAQTKGIQDFGTLTPYRVIQATESKYYEILCMFFCPYNFLTPLALPLGYDKKQYFPLGTQLNHCFGTSDLDPAFKLPNENEELLLVWFNKSAVDVTINKALGQGSGMSTGKAAYEALSLPGTLQYRDEVKAQDWKLLMTAELKNNCGSAFSQCLKQNYRLNSDSDERLIEAFVLAAMERYKDEFKRASNTETTQVYFKRITALFQVSKYSRTIYEAIKKKAKDESIQYKQL